MISQLHDLSPMVKKNEPARLNLSRVRTNFNWRPTRKNTRTAVACFGGSVLIRIARAA